MISKKVLFMGAIACAPAASAHAQSIENSPKIAFLDVLRIAEPEPDSPGESGPTISAVLVTGNEAIDELKYQARVEAFFGEQLTDQILEQLSDELAALAKEEGFPYARTTIDRGAAAYGIVQVQVDEGRIDDITIQGFDNVMARRTLDRLIGKAASKRDLESALLMVSDIPSVILRGAKLSRSDGQNTLVVTLDERGAEGRIGIDNYGTDTFGPIRASGSARIANVISSADEVRTLVRINPIEPDELLFVSGSYQTQLDAQGLTLDVSGGLGSTDPGGALDGSGISGDTRRLSARLSAPVKRTKDASAWVEGEIAYISIEQNDLGALLRTDTVVTAAIGLRTQVSFAGGSARTGVWLERGLGVLGATRLGDALASRFDGDGVFTKVRFNADTRVSLAKRLSVLLAVGGQIADRPLLASDEIGLGGAYRTRGYDFAEVLGDEGIYGLAEMRYTVDTGDLPLDFLQFYAFADGGYVSDIARSGGEGSLFSAGPGLRARLGIVDLEFESAFPLGGSGARDQGDDPEINIRAGLNF
ncbi:ShlB/FhaC/HecB family hemolysin secretion/activation protein [Erythrobacter insulae]|uniref:ShlB/FhaC/HecB family hemolysin secretion/activation protein n=1 Tax=Erythrobacter insulae TaxID=2584124 RepID=A0A547PCT6_9SPHN|nr:ShlB/FhaC/HecB family hemolysin secretion/activation protein [Erythrobacter insulae]TRD11953.1 ShlB/FhaC/HecB family hemolysin secretion/activation protein [Erythrobacter insulae]